MSDLKQIVMMDMLVTLAENGDERVREWFLMTSIWPTVFILFFYILFVIIGQQYMKLRMSFQLRKFLFIYNCFQIVLCTFITYESVFVWIKGDYSLLCQPVDFSQRSIGIKGCNACWWFYIMQIVDLLETISFVLRKQYKQITFLNVYYHGMMTFFGWCFAKYVPGGQTLFIVIINSFVNILVHTHCILNTYKHHSQNRIFQFVVIIIHTIVNIQQPCNYPKLFDIIFLIFSTTVLILFSRILFKNLNNQKLLLF